MCARSLSFFPKMGREEEGELSTQNDLDMPCTAATADMTTSLGRGVGPKEGDHRIFKEPRT
jgi:hypothetical protein